MKTKISEKTQNRNRKLAKKLAKNKKKIQKRLARKSWKAGESPMFRGGNIQYEVSEKTRALDAGGIGIMHEMVRWLGLNKVIDRDL